MNIHPRAKLGTGWGPRLIAGVTGHPHSTVHRVLLRHGISRPPRPARERAVRYEWPCPGDLLHVDTKRYARFERPGHRVTGVRDKTSAELRAGWGYETPQLDRRSAADQPRSRRVGLGHLVS
jgi:hypothetical protein